MFPTDIVKRLALDWVTVAVIVAVSPAAIGEGAMSTCVTVETRASAGAWTSTVSGSELESRSCVPPEYRATIVCTPTERFETTSVAAPAPSSSTAGTIGTGEPLLVSWNVTSPCGVPSAPTRATVAVSGTAVPSATVTTELTMASEVESVVCVSKSVGSPLETVRVWGDEEPEPTKKARKSGE